MSQHNKVLIKRHRIRPEKLLYCTIGIILCSIIASGALFYFAKIDLISYLPGIHICPFHAFTGSPCPGCGMSRAFLLLGQFKIRAALEMNHLSVPLLFLMLLYFFFGRIPSWLQNDFLIRASLFTILVFWIIRLCYIQ